MRVALPLLLLAGCAGWAEPTAEDRARLRDRTLLPRYLRSTTRVVIESPWISGSFAAVLVGRIGEDPAVRLQLLPDLGGKALDLLARPDRVRGSFPHAGESVDWRLPGDAKPHPLLFIAITLLEEFGPPPAGRVTGVRDGACRLRPVVPGTRVEMRSEEGSGEVLTFSWGGATWTYAGGRVVEAPGLRIRVSGRDHQPATADIEALLK